MEFDYEGQRQAIKSESRNLAKFGAVRRAMFCSSCLDWIEASVHVLMDMEQRLAPFRYTCAQE